MTDVLSHNLHFVGNFVPNLLSHQIVIDIGSCTNKAWRKSVYSNPVLVHIPTAKSPRALLARQLQHNNLVDRAFFGNSDFGITQPVAPHSTMAVLRHHPGWQHQRTRCILSQSAQKLLRTTFHPESSSSQCQSLAKPSPSKHI